MNESYRIVPTDFTANLLFRRDLYRMCHKDKGFRQGVWNACQDDVLFWLNAFCFCYEPRPRFNAAGIRLPTQIPFIAWDHQAPAILAIKENLGQRDIGVEKSRGEGMSWIGILLAMHSWLFDEMAAIGLVSKDEIAVDDPNDPDSLMWKGDFTLKMIPDWMSGVRDVDYKRDITNHVLRNFRNGSTISGYAATSNVASGGRKLFFIMDELAKFPKPKDKEAMASTQHVTESRLVISTPLGSSGAYYEAMHQLPGPNFVRIVLDWKQNPTRNRGLYEIKNGKAVAVDPENPLLAEYEATTDEVLNLWSRLRRKGFKLENKHRSPWYDRECDRIGATPQNIAQELDRDYGGSAYRVFGDTFLDKSREQVRPAAMVGDLDFGQEKLDVIRFDKIDNGPIRLWFPLDAVGNPPGGLYALGADIATGTGGSFASNSTLYGMDLLTGEQVLEYASNTITPAEFADLSISLAKWLHDAYLGWEANGPGSAFTRQVYKRQYSNIYYRKDTSRRGNRNTRSAGWWTDDKSKEIMFSEFQSALVMNEATIRSRELQQECGQYIRKEGKIEHALVKNAAQDSRGVSHGDRVVAACVCIQVARDRPIEQLEDALESKDAPIGTMEHRMQIIEQSEKVENDGWDDGIFITL